MPLPDRLKTEELETHGFKRVSENRAEHERYRSYRNRCDKCGDWVKQTEGGKGRVYCKECRRAWLRSLQGTTKDLSKWAR
jgi:formylmethanofuran dehydrogenase subunit E